MARTTDNEHSGHRERMRKKFIENGFDVFETHEALEMFLYYAIPRKDTNPLAHRLLDRYITVGGVCDAPIDELMKEFGLSENAAALLKMLPERALLFGYKIKYSYRLKSISKEIGFFYLAKSD